MRPLIALAFCAALGVLLLLELLLRALPVSTASLTDYYHHPDLLTYPAGHRWQVSTGWDLRNPQRLRANNFGFVADREFVQDARAVALIGDSYVEASMLNAADRPAPQLERLLDSTPVYAMGTPGTALLDYAQRMQWAAERFGTKRFVLIVESGDVVQSLCGSGNVVSRCLDAGTFAPHIERVAAASVIKRTLRHSALAQYMVSQIRVDPGRLLGSIWSRRVPETTELRQITKAPSLPTVAAIQLARSRIDAVLGAFADATVRARQGAHWLVVLDGARRAPWRADVDGHFERGYLIERLQQMGATVIDLQRIYAKTAEMSPWALEVGPYDGHLNRLGVRLAMEAVAERLRP